MQKESQTQTRRRRRPQSRAKNVEGRTNRNAKRRQNAKSLLEGFMMVSVDIDVVQDLAGDLRVARAQAQNHAGEEMKSPVDVGKESVDLSVDQPLVFAVLKAGLLLQHRLAKKKWWVAHTVQKD